MINENTGSYFISQRPFVLTGYSLVLQRPYVFMGISLVLWSRFDLDDHFDVLKDHTYFI